MPSFIYDIIDFFNLYIILNNYNIILYFNNYKHLDQIDLFLGLYLFCIIYGIINIFQNKRIKDNS